MWVRSLTLLLSSIQRGEADNVEAYDYKFLRETRQTRRKVRDRRRVLDFLEQFFLEIMAICRLCGKDSPKNEVLKKGEKSWKI